MTKKFSRRLFLGSALGFMAAQALGDAPARSVRPVARPGSTTPIIKSVDEILAGSRLSGEVSFAVMDVRSGRLHEAENGLAGLPPASVMKAVTTLYALDALGADHRFPTTVQATGPVVDGVVQGDLVLAGGGDPTLDTDRLAGLAKALKEAGITGVEGDFLVWGGFLPFTHGIDSEQPDHVGYNPAVSGLNLNYNRVHFQWKKEGGGYTVTMDARSGSHTPDVNFARMAVENRSLPVYTYDDQPSRDDWTVARAALGNGGARWLPVRKPELYAGEVFQTFARTNGIALKTPKVTKALPDGEIVAQIESASLTTILGDMMTYSTNLTAEVVGQAATQARKGEVESIKASAAEMTAWARETYGLSEAVALVDHSGLGDDSRMTAQDMVTMLREARGAGPLRSLMKPVAMRDDSRRVIENHPVEVDAKTGTLNFVSALAGYVTAVDGTELAFAIFTADAALRDALTKAERERPEGGRTWNVRSKKLQQELLQRWGYAFVEEASESASPEPVSALAEQADQG